MSTASDQKYLLSDQYRDASNLNARIRLHQRFSVNTYGWHRWVFDQFDLSPTAHILELGCGPGHLWLENLRRIPEGWDVVLSDFSPGMLDEGRRALRTSSRTFRFEIMDAQSILFPDEMFDAVVANHMLFHVPDRAKAFSEIRRVLRPSGLLYAATNGRSHLREIDELLRRFDPGVPWEGGFSETFTLENGRDQMSPWFSHVMRRRYEDALVITEAHPLIEYVLSTRARAVLAGARLPDFARYVERELVQRGAIRVTKDAGILIGVRADGQ